MATFGMVLFGYFLGISLVAFGFVLYDVLS